MCFPPVEYDAELHPAKSRRLWRPARSPGVVGSGVGSVRMLTHQFPFYIIRESIKRFDRFTRPR